MVPASGLSQLPRSLTTTGIRARGLALAGRWPVRYCLNLPIGGEAAHPRALARLAVVAEDAGWDAVFVEDYILYQNRQDLPADDPWGERWPRWPPPRHRSGWAPW
jgi:hypothetical protein